jgi:hypothetical protein
VSKELPKVLRPLRKSLKVLFLTMRMLLLLKPKQLQPELWKTRRLLLLLKARKTSLHEQVV